MTKCIGCGGSINHIKSDLAKCNYCGKVYSVVNGELKDANLASVYDYAATKAKSQNEEELQEAITIFEAIGSYKDGYNRAMECRNIIRKQRVLAEERRLEARRQAELEEIENEKKRQQQLKVAKIKGISIAAAVVCVVAIVGIVVITSSIKRSRYDNAMELYNLQQYEEALEVFQTIEGYSDSQTYIVDISNLIEERENAYSQGVSFYNSGLYEKAIGELADISGYLDVKDYIENASNALYQQAKDLVETEEYAAAKEKLETIPKECNVFTQGQVLLSEIDDILIAQENAQNYEMAVNYFNSEQYEMAQPLFIKLGAYEDATNYLSQIGTIFYNKASELYNQKEYTQCGDMLAYIDASDEWSEFTLATELFNKAVQAYRELIVPEAKNICRSEGYTSMVTYVNSKKCSVLDSRDIEELKAVCDIKMMPLSDIKPYYESKECMIEGDSCEDNMGNSYSYALCGNGTEYTASGRKRDRSMTWSINGEYQYFNATVACETNGEGIIRIWGDEKLLWSDEEVSAKKKPYPIQIDVAGIVDLKIEMYGWISPYGDVILGNPTLSE